ncbi:hypothetical protein KM043_005128 [Ampulex compressa]|nr:hypothetical protein KM043_005128 [Ampulex compressa]
MEIANDDCSGSRRCRGFFVRRTNGSLYRAVCVNPERSGSSAAEAEESGETNGERDRSDVADKDSWLVQLRIKPEPRLANLSVLTMYNALATEVDSGERCVLLVLDFIWIRILACNDNV